MKEKLGYQCFVEIEKDTPKEARENAMKGVREKALRDNGLYEKKREWLEYLIGYIQGELEGMERSLREGDARETLASALLGGNEFRKRVLGEQAAIQKLKKELEWINVGEFSAQDMQLLNQAFN